MIIASAGHSTAQQHRGAISARVACRYNLKMAQRQQEREKTRVMKSLMYGLVNSANDGKAPADQLRNARNLAFVITDLQSSTAQSAASPSAFLKVQEIHDTVPFPLSSLLHHPMPCGGLLPA